MSLAACGRDAADIEAYGRALDDTRAKYNPMFAAVRSYRAELAAIRAAHATGAISADEMNAAIGRTRTAALASIAAIKGRTTAIGQMASGSRLAAMQSRMLLFQLNDIGVSLAGGMSPLMVLVQQGSQITQMYAGQGGVNAALRQTADLAKGAVAGAGSAARGVLGLARAHPVADRRRRGRRRRPRRAPPRDQRDRRDPGLLRRRDAGGLAVDPRRRGLPW